MHVEQLKNYAGEPIEYYAIFCNGNVIAGYSTRELADATLSILNNERQADLKSGPRP